MSEQLTLYSAKICPFAHRVELALEEAGADYKKYYIDLQNKPSWYAPRINPAGKVPAITFGGPKVSPDEPSLDSQKLVESLILVEFVADLYPDSSLLPNDPVLRAKARFFIDTVSNKVVPAWAGSVMHSEPLDAIFKGIEAIQELLPNEGQGKYALGDIFTIADVSVASFLARLDVALKNDLCAFGDGEAKRAYEVLQSDHKYERFRRYFQDIKSRDSFKATFDEEYVRDRYTNRLAAARAHHQIS